MLDKQMAYRLSILALPIVVGLLALGAWAAWPDDLTETETEAHFRAGYPHWRNVSCTTTGSGDWDYACGYSYLSEGELLRETILVDVNDAAVTNRSAP